MCGGKLDCQLSVSAKSACKDFHGSSFLNDPRRFPDSGTKSLQIILYEDTSDPVDVDISSSKSRAHPLGRGMVSTFTVLSDKIHDTKHGLKSFIPATPQPKFNITAGPTLAFRLDNDQPLDSVGDYLSDHRIDHVNDMD